jgi:hypothetical protein
MGEQVSGTDPDVARAAQDARTSAGRVVARALRGVNSSASPVIGEELALEIEALASKIERTMAEPPPEPPSRESQVDLDGDHAADYLIEEAERVMTGSLDVVWIESGEQVQLVVIPARNYVRPGQCNCKHCPWKGDHGGGPREEV